MGIVQRNWLDYDDQWLDGFRYRIPFYHQPFAVKTVAAGGVVQTDIPVLITIGSSIGDGEKRDTTLTRIFDEIGANNKKIAITSADGVTQQFVCIAQWDESAEQAYIWFRADAIGQYGLGDKRQARKFYLYYDGLADDNTTYVGDPGDTPSDNVWQNFYVTFMLQEQPTEGVRNFKDLVNEYDGRFFEGTGDATASQSDFDFANQRFLKAVDFEDSESQFINYDTGRNFLSGGDVEAMSVFALVDVETRAADQRLLDYGDGGSDRVFRFGINGSQHWEFHCRNNDVIIAQVIDSGDAISDGQQWLAASYNGGSGAGDIELWRANGISVATGTPTGAQIGNPPGAIANNPRIGSNTNNVLFFDGDVAFVSIAKFAVDVNWVDIWYRCMQNTLWVFQQTEEKPSTIIRNRLPIFVKPDNLDSDLGVFNLKIFLTASAGDDSQDVTAIFDELAESTGGRKVRITDEDGVTILPAEIIYWDYIGKIAVFSTIVYDLDSTDGRNLFLYYDKDVPPCGETVNTGNQRPTPVSDENVRFNFRVSKQKPNFPTAIEIAATNIGWTGIDGSQTLQNLDTNDVAVDSKLGPYLEIDYTGGSNEDIQFADNDIFDRSSTQAFSLEALVKFPAELTAQNRIFTKRESGGTNIGWELQADSGNDNFRVVFDVGATVCVLSGSTLNIDDGNWKHVIMTYDGSDAAAGWKMYLNGADDTNVTTDNFPLAASMANAVVMAIGSREGAQANPTNMDLMEVAWYAAAITAARAKAQFHNLLDTLVRFEAVEQYADFQDLAPAVLEYTAIPAFHVGFPTVFVQHTAVNLKLVPGTHIAKSEAALALIGEAIGAKAKILTAAGASPGIEE